MRLNPEVYDESSFTLMQQRGILRDDERVEDALARTVDSLIDIDKSFGSNADENFRQRVYAHVENGVFVFGTPLLTNAGRENKVTAACTVMPLHTEGGRLKLERFFSDADSTLGNALGTGYDLSETEDPAGVLIELNDALNRVNDALLAQNKRPVASMATLRADHPEVLSFVKAKRDADFSKWRLNISLFVTEELFEKAVKDELWALKNADGTSAGYLEAKTLVREIAECAHYCGEPGVLFKDRSDADNPTPQWEYQSTAPCAEVAMAPGEACQFSYINLGVLLKESPNNGNPEFDFEAFGQAVRDMTRLLDASVEQTIAHNDVIALPLVEQKRRIGVGITGFADLLIKLKIPYDDPRAVELAAQVSEVLDFSSKLESVELAEERGAFPAFDDSRYQDEAWLKRKMHRSTGIVPQADWEDLFDRIQASGIRNAATTSLPPTGTSSTIVRTSKSLEPHYELTTHRGELYPSIFAALAEEGMVHHGLGRTGVLAADISPTDLSTQLPYLKLARELSPEAHLKIQTSFQSFLDESLAKTINLPNDATVEDVEQILMYSFTSNIKGITVFRDGCLQERNL